MSRSGIGGSFSTKGWKTNKSPDLQCPGALSQVTVLFFQEVKDGKNLSGLFWEELQGIS